MLFVFRQKFVKQKKMIKKFLLLVFIIIALPSIAKVGINKNYWIISQKEYGLRVSKGKDIILKRYIVVPEINSDFKTISNSDTEIVQLAKFSYLLQKNKTKYINNYIENCDKNKEINQLIQGLYYFSQLQYKKAIEVLTQFNNPDYQFLKYLLIADCKYELLLNKQDYKKVITDYQKALDIANAEKNKTLINNRIKFIKYR